MTPAMRDRARRLARLRRELLVAARRTEREGAAQSERAGNPRAS